LGHVLLCGNPGGLHVRYECRILRNDDDLLLQLSAGQLLVARLVGLGLRSLHRFHHRLVVLRKVWRYGLPVARRAGCE
jgi:hypothetical protein